MRKRKGFTLIELIVVIAIIGVLSAILVPSYLQYVEQAKLSADKNDVKNMNTILTAYMIKNGVDDYEAPEIIDIINSDEMNYSFMTRLPDYSFWYNENTREIEMLDNTAVESQILALKDNSEYALLATSSNTTSVEEIIPNKLLLSQNSKYSNATSRLRNLTRAEDFDAIKAELMSLGITEEHIEKFNPVNTLYINSYDGFTSATLSDTQLANAKAPYVERIVYASGIVSIPKLNVKKIGIGTLSADGSSSIAAPIRLPITVKTVEKGALANIVSESRITGVNSREIQFEIGSLSSFLKTGNSSIQEEELILTANNQISVEFTNSLGNQSINSSSGISYFYKDEHNVIPTIDIITYQKDKDAGNPLLKGANIKLNLDNVTDDIVSIEYVTKTLNYSLDGTKILSKNTVKIYGDSGLIGYFHIIYATIK